MFEGSEFLTIVIIESVLVYRLISEDFLPIIILTID